MSNQNLITNFKTVESLYSKVQAELHQLSSAVGTASTEPKDNTIISLEGSSLTAFRKANDTKIAQLYHSINKALSLLEVNILIIANIVQQPLSNDYQQYQFQQPHGPQLLSKNDTISRPLHQLDKLDYLVKYDKYTEKFKDFKITLTQLQLKLCDVYEELVTQQRQRLLQAYAPTAPDVQNDNNSAAANQQQQTRDDLFAARSKEIETLSTNEKVLKTNQSITSTLQNVYGIMEANVINSDLVIETFLESTNSLIRLSDRYDFLSNTLLSSKQLVQELQKADSTDLRNMKLALAWLGVVCLWILWRRVLKYPVYLLVWVVWSSIRTSLYVVGLFNNKSGTGVNPLDYVNKSNALTSTIGAQYAGTATSTATATATATTSGTVTHTSSNSALEDLESTIISSASSFANAVANDEDTVIVSKIADKADVGGAGDAVHGGDLLNEYKAAEEVIRDIVKDTGAAEDDGKQEEQVEHDEL